MNTPADADFFSDKGYRMLALALLRDAVTEIEKNPNSDAALDQDLWLRGRSGGDGLNPPITAKVCFEMLAGPKPDGLKFLCKLVHEQPAAAKRAFDKAASNFDEFDELISGGSEESVEAETRARIEEYRSMARSH